jgi:hypothetical protein
MARIAQSALQPEWLADAGRKLIIFRGRGGTGKTMLLLHLAWKLYQDLGARILILTYNKALLADIRRLLTLIGVGDASDERSIQVRTVHSFLGAVFHGLELIGPEDDLLARYDEMKRGALEYIRAGGITREDITRLLQERSGAFGWDYVFIDEAQDWPDDERDLLRALYPSDHFAIADGVDQFVRSEAPCDWKHDLARSEARVIPLTRCLRMKASLAKFTNYVAEELGLAGWRVEAHDEAPGGRVLIIEGDYFASRELHDRLMQGNAADGNQPVDMLVCVPPGHVIRDNVVHSVAGDRLRAWGEEVWYLVSA